MGAACAAGTTMAATATDTAKAENCEHHDDTYAYEETTSHHSANHKLSSSGESFEKEEVVYIFVIGWVVVMGLVASAIGVAILQQQNKSAAGGNPAPPVPVPTVVPTLGPIMPSQPMEPTISPTTAPWASTSPWRAADDQSRGGDDG